MPRPALWSRGAFSFPPRRIRAGHARQSNRRSGNGGFGLICSCVRDTRKKPPYFRHCGQVSQTRALDGSVLASRQVICILGMMLGCQFRAFWPFCEPQQSNDFRTGAQSAGANVFWTSTIRIMYLTLSRCASRPDIGCPSRGAASHGRRIVNNVPSFLVEVTSMRPPCDLATSRAMYSPMPMLPGRFSFGCSAWSRGSADQKFLLTRPVQWGRCHCAR